MEIHERHCRHGLDHHEDEQRLQLIDEEDVSVPLDDGAPMFESPCAPLHVEERCSAVEACGYFPFGCRMDAYDFIFHLTALTPVRLRQNYLRFRLSADTGCSLPIRQSAWMSLLRAFPIMPQASVLWNEHSEAEESILLYLSLTDMFSKIVQVPDVGLRTQQLPRLGEDGVSRTEFHNSRLMYQHPALCSHAEYVLSTSAAPACCSEGNHVWPAVCLGLGDVFRRDFSQSRTLREISRDVLHPKGRSDGDASSVQRIRYEYFRVCGLSRIEGGLAVAVRCRRLVNLEYVLRHCGRNARRYEFVKVASELTPQTWEHVFVETDDIQEFTAPSAQPMLSFGDRFTAEGPTRLIEAHAELMIACIELCAWKYVHSADEITVDDCGITTMEGMWNGDSRVTVDAGEALSEDQMLSLTSRGCTCAVVVADAILLTARSDPPAIVEHDCSHSGECRGPWDDFADLLWTFVRPLRWWRSSVRHITEEWDGGDEEQEDSKSQFRSRSRNERCVAFSMFGDGFRTGQPVIGIYLRVQNMPLALSKLRRNVFAVGYAKGKVKLVKVLGKLYDELVELERGRWVTWADGTRAFTRYVLVQTKLDSKERYPLCGCREAAKAVNGCIGCAHAYREDRKVLTTDVTHQTLRDVRMRRYGVRRWTEACALVDECRRLQGESVIPEGEISVRLREAGYEELDKLNVNCFYGGRWGYRLSFNPFLQSPPCVFHNLCTSGGLMNQLVQFLDDRLSGTGLERFRRNMSLIHFSGSFRALRKLLKPPNRGLIGRLTGMQTAAFTVYLPFCARGVVDKKDCWKDADILVMQMGGESEWKAAMHELVSSAARLVYLTFHRGLPTPLRKELGPVGSRFVRLYGMLLGEEKILNAQKPHDCAFHHEEIDSLYANPNDSSTAVEESKHR